MWTTAAAARGSLARRRALLSPGTPCPARAPKTYKLRLFQSLYGFIALTLTVLTTWRLQEAPRGPSRSDLECQLSLHSPPCPDFRNVLWRATCLVLASQLTCCMVHLFWALTLPSRPRITASLSMLFFCYCWNLAEAMA